MRVFIILLSVGILAGAGWVYVDTMPTQRAQQAGALEVTGQDAAWDFARNADDPAVLIDFLQAYPDSEHATVAFALLERIAIEAENGVQVTQQLGRPATTPILD